MLSAHSIIEPVVGKHKGHIYRFDGETAIVVFPSCDRAFACAEAIWKEVADYNFSRLDQDYQIRMGCVLDYGELVFRGYDIMGEVLDRAMSLSEDASETTEVLVTQDFMQKVSGKSLPRTFCFLGERVAEHLPHGPVRHCSVAFAM